MNWFSKKKMTRLGLEFIRQNQKKYLVISSYSTLTTEYQILNANTPDKKFKVFQPRTRGLEYSIAHYDDSFYVLSNADGAKILNCPKRLKTN